MAQSLHVCTNTAKGVLGYHTSVFEKNSIFFFSLCAFVVLYCMLECILIILKRATAIPWCNSRLMFHKRHLEVIQ